MIRMRIFQGLLSTMLLGIVSDANAATGDRCYSVSAAAGTEQHQLGRLPTMVILKPGPSNSIWGGKVKDVDWIGGRFTRSFFDGEGNGPYWFEEPGRLFVSVGGLSHSWNFELAAIDGTYTGPVKEHVDIPGQDLPIHQVELLATGCPGTGSE